MYIGYKLYEPMNSKEKCEEYFEMEKYCKENDCHITKTKEYWIIEEGKKEEHINTYTLTPVYTLFNNTIPNGGRYCVITKDDINFNVIGGTKIEDDNALVFKIS